MTSLEPVTNESAYINKIDSREFYMNGIFSRDVVYHIFTKYPPRSNRDSLTKALTTDKAVRAIIHAGLRYNHMSVQDNSLFMLIALKAVTLEDLTISTSYLVTKVKHENTKSNDLDVSEQIVSQVNTKLPADLRERMTPVHRVAIMNYVNNRVMKPRLGEAYTNIVNDTSFEAIILQDTNFQEQLGIMPSNIQRPIVLIIRDAIQKKVVNEGAIHALIFELKKMTPTNVEPTNGPAMLEDIKNAIQAAIDKAAILPEGNNENNTQAANEILTEILKIIIAAIIEAEEAEAAARKKAEAAARKKAAEEAEASARKKAVEAEDLPEAGNNAEAGNTGSTNQGSRNSMVAGSREAVAEASDRNNVIHATYVDNEPVLHMDVRTKRLYYYDENAHALVPIDKILSAHGVTEEELEKYLKNHNLTNAEIKAILNGTLSINNDDKKDDKKDDKEDDKEDDKVIVEEESYEQPNTIGIILGITFGVVAFIIAIVLMLYLMKEPTTY